MKVIVLRSNTNKGKSTTLKLLYSLLLIEGFSQVTDKFWNIGKTPNYLHYDIRSILVWNGIKVGIITRGDVTKHLLSDLQFLKDEGCQLAICSSRNWKTWSVSDHFAETLFVGKSKGENSSEMYPANARDAKRLLDLVKGSMAVAAWKSIK